MHQEFRVGDIRPNPYRRIEHYPIIPEKVTALEESYERTGFWDNVVVRFNAAGEPEQAFGHHRVKALIEKYGADHKAFFIVKPFDEAAMLRAMADENGEVYGANAAVDIETLRALLDAWGDGTLPRPGMPATNRHKFDPGSNSDPVFYDANDVHEFFGWPLFRRTRAAIEGLEAITAGGMKVEDFEGVSIRKAHAAAKAVTKAVKRAKEFGDPSIVTKVRKAVTDVMADESSSSETTIKEAGDHALHEALPRRAKPEKPVLARETVISMQGVIGTYLQRDVIKIGGQPRPVAEVIAEIAKHREELGRDAEDVGIALTRLAQRATDLAALFSARQLKKGA